MNQYLPLYAGIREQLVQRLSAGEWQPGTVLPSEMALAAELGVSQGTVRKAIDSLVSDGALRRAQGRGTFVAEQTAELANFRFLRITDGKGQRVIPEVVRWKAMRERATMVDLQTFGIEPQSAMHVIHRTRSIEGTAAITEVIRIPDTIMPGFSEAELLPNALYPYYQSAFGVTVLRTEDQITAVAADAASASDLSLPIGSPLLRSERVAYDLTDRAVEHRITHVVTQDHAFSITLG